MSSSFVSVFVRRLNFYSDGISDEGVRARISSKAEGIIEVRIREIS